MLVAGCASMEQAEEIVAKSDAQAFWDARPKAKVDKAYALTTPAYRKVHTLEQFKQYGSTFEIGDQHRQSDLRSGKVHSTRQN